MWIAKEAWEGIKESELQLRLRTREIQGENGALREQNKVLQANMDWMRTRLTQLEKQNAQYIYQIAGVKIPVPEFQPAINLHDAANTMAELADTFEDMGNERAEKLGIGWNLDGTVKYPE